MAAIQPVAQSAVGLLLAEIVRHAAQEAADKDAAYSRIEAIGFHLGRNLVELHASSATRFKDQLDVIKFLCKEIWQVMHQKQIDNLRTNHKGVYVLHDNHFPAFVSLAGLTPTDDQAQLLMAHTCGAIRGVLAAVGMEAEVVGEIATLPACRFHLDIKEPGGTTNNPQTGPTAPAAPQPAAVQPTPATKV